MSEVSFKRYDIFSGIERMIFDASHHCNKNGSETTQTNSSDGMIEARRRRQQRRLNPFLFAGYLLLLLPFVSYVEGFVSDANTKKAPHRRSVTTTNYNRHIEPPVLRHIPASPAAASTMATLLHSSSHGTHHIGEHVLQTTLAGRIWPTLIKISHLARPDKLRKMIGHVQGTMHWQGVVFLALIAYGTVPLTQYLWEKSSEKEGISGGRSFTDLKRKQAASVLSGLARVALSAYAVDLVCVALTSIGFAFPSLWNVPRAYGKIAYTLWGLQRFLQFKTAALCRLYRVSPDTLQSGKLDVLNRALTVASVGLVSLFLFDWLSIQMGMAFKGLLAFGSVGTLAFTLASQDLVSQFISGIFLTASNKVYAGDDVVFGDGTKGTIVRLGFMDTVLRSGDNSITSVPNSKLASQKVSNLSRVRISQVTQTLRFHYEDADEIPALLDTIKSEIVEACPRLITDGSRPFRVFWTGFKEDHLEVMVDAHFQIPPIGDAYWINRQRVLMAINRAVKKHNLQFAKLYRVEAGQQPVWRVVLPANERQQTIVPAPALLSSPSSAPSLASPSLTGSSVRPSGDHHAATIQEVASSRDAKLARSEPADATIDGDR